MDRSVRISRPEAGTNAQASAVSLPKSIASVALLVGGGLLLFLANLLLWLNSAIFNSDNFTQTVDQVLDKPEVQSRLGDVLAAEAVQSGDLETRLRDRLPIEVAFLSPIVASELQDLLGRVAARLLASDFLGDQRDQVIRLLHSRLLAVLEGDDAVVQAQGDRLVLDMGDTLERVFDRIGVTPPERLQGAADSGQVVILDDVTGLAQASFFVRHRQELTWLALIGSVGAFGLVLLTSRPLSTGVSRTGYAVMLVGLLTLLAVFVTNAGLNSIAGERVVAREMLKALETDLKWQSVGWVVLGACVVAIADKRILDTLVAGKAWAGREVESFGTARTLLVGTGIACVGLLLV